MCRELICLGVARTIGDLDTMLSRAIRIAGKNAMWIAHEDGEIRIYHEGGETALVIEQLPIKI